MSAHLPPPFNTSPPDSLTLITQGAEALLYRTTWWDDDDGNDAAAPPPANPSRGSRPTPVALKIRPRKPWRHPLLDRRLTRQRILAEARVLVRCRRDGVPVPAVYAIDLEAGWSVVEWIEGLTVKAAIRAWRKELDEGEKREKEVEGLRALLRRVGAVVGHLHAAGVIHGDLTTSNMLLRPVGGEEEEGGLEGEIVLIDFGLAVQAAQEEERAVDLYVLERAFGSTHPKEEAEFGEVLKAYEGCYKGAKTTLRRLEDVRMRGRKKSMLG